MAQTEAKYQADNERFDWLYDHLTDKQVIEYASEMGLVMDDDDDLRIEAANDLRYWDEHFGGIADDRKCAEAQERAL